jgi:hypothetical protein
LLINDVLVAKSIVDSPSIPAFRRAFDLNLPSLPILRGEQVRVGGCAFLVQITDPETTGFKLVGNNAFRNSPTLCRSMCILLVG